MPNLQGASKRKRILVITGTTGFDSLVRNIDENRELEGGFDITLQTGDGAYKPRYKSFFDFDKGLKNRLSEYDFFITHAGAGTIFMLLEQKMRVLVVPNTERADKHQIELAQYVKSNNLCAVCQNVSDVAMAITEIDRTTQNLQPYEKVEFNAVRDLLRYIYE
ncbi:PssE/Cps14G family polysaccharide biosynthesis glycosyltransferase [Candidatus Thiothrix sp. Deng01]|uniref:PssE/Cps14G family polysaccharide biosynthesis glycosyltransferase n=1 Tax=Candidatus Thiothrix phosphatis TaxID=3112415 RepID=A0ABU6D1T6_9GAMM|nr:PssE/Cps14G family polysaccharide biosynthesis glycosyltransferase [Candidatus Thiothrix sp. Deng01]MEB4592643.1 PssE/Cps14G family polysaccharide biosynthesis glycosyltransferase [Candidatus Thiothrix sp. Deng01]